MRITETILEKACTQVEGFAAAYQKLNEKVVLAGQSKSTLNNYARQLAHLCLHFDCLPEQLDDEQINGYLAALASGSKSPSLSSFKHSIYGLRFYFRLVGHPKRAINLPSLKKQDKLPVVLSHQELIRLFNAPELIKHRALLSLVYAAGLRAGEVCRLKIADIDSQRMTIFIRQSKGNKDRYVPLSPAILPLLRNYYTACKPVEWLFNGKEPGQPFSVRGLQWVMGETVKKARISKEVCVHSLRHSYATHLLEQGLDLVSIKERLGHAFIQTTMVYLHVAQIIPRQIGSPYDELLKKRRDDKQDKK